MADPSRRSRIIDAFAERLAAIRSEHGFGTDVGHQVFRGEAPTLGPDDPDDAVVVFAGEDEVANQAENLMLTLPIEIQAVTRADVTQPSVRLEALIADIKRAVETDERTLGGLVAGVTFLRGSTRALEREAGSTTVGAAVRYLVPYRERWGQP